MRSWTVSYGKDGFFVRLEERAWWSVILEGAGAVFDKLTGHVFCCHGKWLEYIPVGRRDKDTGRFWLVQSWVWSLRHEWDQLAFRGERTIMEIPVSREDGIVLWNRPESSWLWEDEEMK